MNLDEIEDKFYELESSLNELRYDLECLSSFTSELLVILSDYNDDLRWEDRLINTLTNKIQNYLIKNYKEYRNQSLIAVILTSSSFRPDNEIVQFAIREEEFAPFLGHLIQNPNLDIHEKNQLKSHERRLTRRQTKNTRAD